MKKFKVLCASALSILLLLTSCLGDTNTEQSFNNLPGVVVNLGGGRLGLETQVGRIYAQGNDMLLMGFSEGDCLLVSFTYDSGDPLNADQQQNGFSYVKLQTQPTSVALVGSYPNMEAPENEKKENEINFDSFKAYGLIQNRLFLTCDYTGNTDQKNDWFVYFDPEAEPEKGKSYNGEEMNIYKVYLRATVRDEGRTPSGIRQDLNAFNLTTQVSRINHFESSNEVYGISIEFPKSFNSDSEPVWESALIAEFAVPKD